MSSPRRPTRPARAARWHYPHGQRFRESVGAHDAEGRREDDVADSQFGRLPGHPGRSARACHRRQGRGFRRGARTRIQGIPAAGAAQCRGDGRGVRPPRLQDRLGRHGQPPDAGRSAHEVPRPDGQAGRKKSLVAADITTNKNMVPFDSRSPFQTSGLRFGTRRPSRPAA